LTPQSVDRDNGDKYRELQPYAGRDATEALKDEAAPEALRWLLTRDDLVSAKLSRKLRRITAVKLRKHRHIPTRAERRKVPAAQGRSWRGWVAVPEEEGSRKQMVYDVTSMFAGLPLLMNYHETDGHRTAMVIFGSSEVEAMLRPWLGKEVQDAELADLLREEHGSFIIGELIEEKTSGKSTKELGKPRTDQVQVPDRCRVL
jgi:hypothetical protein